MEKSETIGKLAEALSQAQGDFDPIIKKCSNPFFNSKYADLEAVISATKSALTKHGLSVAQLPTDDHLETMLMHKSGEWIMSKTPLVIEKKSNHGFGSAISYARRYGLTSILSVGSEDDDGNQATKTPPKTVEKMREALAKDKIFEETAFFEYLHTVKCPANSVEEMSTKWVKWVHENLTICKKKYADWNPTEEEDSDLPF